MTAGGIEPSGGSHGGDNDGWRAPLVIVGLLTVAAIIAAPFITDALSSGSSERPPTQSYRPTVPESIVDPPANSTRESPNPLPARPPGQVAQQIYLSDITRPSREVSSNGYLGFGDANSVSLKCNDSFSGESNRSVSYKLDGLPRNRVSGGLVVESIPNDRVVSIRFFVTADGRKVFEKSVTGQGPHSPIVPFNVGLTGAEVMSIGVVCGEGGDDRGLFLEAALS
jgi:hypothetical protein